MKLGVGSTVLFDMLVLLGFGLAATPALSANLDVSPARQIVENVCGACHGIDGNSDELGTPNLAGQLPHYIRGQLHDFASGDPTNPIMSGIAKTLSDTQIHELALYFSGQTLKKKATPPAKSGSPAAKLVVEGGKIFRGGIVANAVPACASCHGPTAIGMPPEYPRLAGQRIFYVTTQLLAFKKKTRSNDDRAMMRDVAGKLSASQIDAVAAYMNSLP